MMKNKNSLHDNLHKSSEKGNPVRIPLFRAAECGMDERAKQKLHKNTQVGAKKGRKPVFT